MKKKLEFSSENFQFLEEKFCIYLNRRVFVMCNILFPHFPEDAFSHGATHLSYAYAAPIKLTHKRLSKLSHTIN